MGAWSLGDNLITEVTSGLGQSYQGDITLMLMLPDSLTVVLVNYWTIPCDLKC